MVVSIAKIDNPNPRKINSIKIKEKMLKDGYDYNQFKKEHVYFIIDNGTKKLNWIEAVSEYLDKKQPSWSCFVCSC